MGGIPYELGVHEDEVDPRELGGVTPRRRSLWAFAALGAGFWVARLSETWGWDWMTGAAWFGACQGLLAFVLLLRGAACKGLLFGACLCLGAAWFTTRLIEGPPDRLDRLVSHAGMPSPQVITVAGDVLEAPVYRRGLSGALGGFARVSGGWSFPLRVGSIETGAGVRGASGIVRVNVSTGSRERGPDIRVGDRVRVTGGFARIEPPLNPGQPDRRLLGLQEGVVGRLSVSHESLLRVETRGDRAARSRLASWAQDRAISSLGLGKGMADDAGGQGRALLGAMLLGVREGGIDEVDEAFRRVGLVHLVAISGFNLALLAAMASMVMRFAGDRGRLESLGVAGVLGVYLLMVPAESPILRAGVTVLAFLVTESLGRRYDRLTLLGWIACGLLLWRPMDLWSLGFQLSFGIVGSLLWLGRRAEGRLFGVPLRGVVSVGVPIGEHPGLLLRVGRAAARWSGVRLRTACAASLLAWGVAAPVIACHTGMFSPWAPVTSLLAVPAAMVTLSAGYAALFFGFVWPQAGAWLAGGAHGSADALASMVMALDTIPGSSLELPRISAWWAAAAVALVLYWFARGTWRSPRDWAMTALVVVWLGVELFGSTRLMMGTRFRIDTLAVGDGTCHLIRSGDGAMLWDCGSSNPGLGLRELPRALRAVGVSTVETALVTHANLDHFLCLPDVARPLGIQRVYVTRQLLDDAVHHPSSAVAALVRELDRLEIVVLELHAGSTFTLGPAVCEILAPRLGEQPAETNDTSLVGLFRVHTRAGEKRALFTGDIGPAAIAAISTADPALRADIVELPHHGSAKPESIEFVRRVDPRIVLQSTGPQRVGDARWDASRGGRTWHTTASDGAAWVEIKNSGAIRSGTHRRLRSQDSDAEKTPGSAH